MKSIVVWQELSNCEAYELVKSFYSKRHSRKIGTDHAREISASFVQARHYFDAAKGADRSVRPLLGYYGTVALAQGLSLFLMNGRRRCSLAPSHGLSAEGWQQTLTGEKIDLASLTIKANSRGTFPELLEATGHRNILHVHSSGKTGEVNTSGPNSIDTLTLGWLATTTPELINSSKHWLKPRSVKIEPAQRANKKPGVIKVRKHNQGNLTATDIKAIIDGPFAPTIQFCDIEQDDANGVARRLLVDGRVMCLFSDVEDGMGLGVHDLVMHERLPNDAGLSKIGQYFALSYLLSMLVRYHPSIWMDIFQERVASEAAPTLWHAVKQIEETFPFLALEFLNDTA